MKAHVDYQRGEAIIRRNARGSYSILFADGSLSVSFVPTMKQAELEAAREKAWREFCHVVSGCHYAPATIGAIETARELLFGARVKEASNG